MGERKGVIPSERVYYLSEIAATVREYHQRNDELVEKLRLCQHLETAAVNANLVGQRLLLMIYKPNR
jgi:methylmalonyl-CoA mutase